MKKYHKNTDALQGGIGIRDEKSLKVVGAIKSNNSPDDMQISFSGKRIKVKQDINKDGKEDDIEELDANADLTTAPSPQAQSEYAEVMSEINKDELNRQNMSTVDFLSRVRERESSVIATIETGASSGLYPEEYLIFTRKFKRNKVSIDGLGRKESIQAASGAQSVGIQKQGVLSKLGGLFKKNPQQPNPPRNTELK